MSYPQDPYGQQQPGKDPYGQSSGGFPQQSPYSQPFPQQGYGYGPPSGMPQQSQEQGLAIGALICSIVGIFCCGLVSVAGIVMGHIAYAKAKRGESGGQGMAMAAFIIGYAAIALTIIFFILALALNWAVLDFDRY